MAATKEQEKTARKDPLEAIPEKQRKFLTLMVELGGSYAETEDVLAHITKGITPDQVTIPMLLSEMIIRRQARTFGQTIRSLSNPDQQTGG